MYPPLTHRSLPELHPHPALARAWQSDGQVALRQSTSVVGVVVTAAVIVSTAGVDDGVVVAGGVDVVVVVVVVVIAATVASDTVPTAS